MDPTYPLVPVANFLGFILALVPLFTSVHNAANSAICIYAVWIAVMCLNRGVNTVVWRNTSNNLAPVWCDITSHIDICSYTAVTGCSMAISRRLYKITSRRNNRFIAFARNDIIFDCILCCGIPIACAALYYIVQGVRFEIFEEVGCSSNIYPSGVAILVIFGPPLLLCTACLAYYIPALIWTFVSQRRELNAFLAGNRIFNRNHYFRIMTMEIVVLINMIAAIVVLAIDIRMFTTSMNGPFPFWPGWKVIHTNWGPVSFPASVWRQNSWNHFSVRWDEWINPIFAYSFFAVYGLSNQARARYRRALSSVPRLSFSRSSQVKEESLPQVIHLTPGGSDLTTISTKPSTSFQDMSIKVEKHIETHYDPDLFDIEKGQIDRNREHMEDSHSDI